MKVEGPSKTGSAQKSGKAKPSGKTNNAFDDMVVGGAGQVSGAASVQSVARIDALLAVQSVDNPTERAVRRKMYARGDQILQRLDDLKLSLLGGGLTIGQVVNIADMVASHREKINDPKMSALLDEIDLRAQIELAKIRKAMDKEGIGLQ